MDLVTFILFATGFVLLIVGADLLVRGASKLALSVGISPLVVGLTVVAYGTSAPELAVSVQSTYAGAADLAVGNVVGSNIANVLLILGLSALITPLAVAQQLIRLDVPLMIGLSILVFLMGLDGSINRLDGFILVAGAISYTVFAIYQSRKESKAIQKEYQEKFGPQTQLKTGAGQLLAQLGMIIAGLALLVLGANWLIDGAVALARLFGVSELIVGLTVVAVGTSLPEVATSVLASIRGERDIAVGNIVGSNIFNILAVLGGSATVGPAGITVSNSALYFDIPVMIAVAVACLPIFFTGSLIARWEGSLFLGSYLAYTGYLYLSATRSDTLAGYSTIMLGAVLPLTVIILAVSLLRNIQRSRRSESSESSRPSD